jgi:hypothetical protein
MIAYSISYGGLRSPLHLVLTAGINNGTNHVLCTMCTSRKTALQPAGKTQTCNNMFEEQNHSTWASSSTPKDTNTDTDTDTDTDTQDILILIDVYEVQFNDMSSCVATSTSVRI